VEQLVEQKTVRKESSKLLKALGIQIVTSPEASRVLGDDHADIGRDSLHHVPEDFPDVPELPGGLEGHLTLELQREEPQGIEEGSELLGDRLQWGQAFEHRAEMGPQVPE